MLSRYAHGGLTWVDLESPTREEVRQIMEEFSLDHFTAEELLLPTTKPRVESHDRYFYCILHFPALRHSHKTTEQELDFVVGRDFIITTRYESIDPLHSFSKVFEADSIINDGVRDDHAGFLFFSMLRRLYMAVDHEIDFIHTDMLHIERHIFTGEERRMVQAISGAARDLLNLRQTVEPHREIHRDLLPSATALFGDPYARYVKAIENDYYRIHNHIMRHTESLHELRETNNSLLSTKETETMRILTISALITFPLTLLATVLSIRSPDNPLAESGHEFWLVTAILILCGAVMIAYFKHRRWL